RAVTKYCRRSVLCRNDDFESVFLALHRGRSMRHFAGFGPAIRRRGYRYAECFGYFISVNDRRLVLEWDSARQTRFEKHRIASSALLNWLNRTDPAHSVRKRRYSV